MGGTMDHSEEEDGRDAEIRTRDPLTPSQVRYQAALHPADNYFFFALLLPARPGSGSADNANSEAGEPPSVSRIQWSPRRTSARDARAPSSNPGAAPIAVSGKVRSDSPAAASASSANRRRTPARVNPSTRIRRLRCSTRSTSTFRYTRGPAGVLATPRSGNSASHPRNTNCGTPAISQTSVARNAGRLGIETASTRADEYMTSEAVCDLSRPSFSSAGAP